MVGTPCKWTEEHSQGVLTCFESVILQGRNKPADNVAKTDPTDTR